MVFKNSKLFKDDARRFVLEDIVVYTVLLSLVAFWDFLPRLGVSLGTVESSHPLSFGVFQFLGLLFFLVQLLRASNRWRYYS